MAKTKKAAAAEVNNESMAQFLDQVQILKERLDAAEARIVALEEWTSSLKIEERVEALSKRLDTLF